MNRENLTSSYVLYVFFLASKIMSTPQAAEMAKDAGLPEISGKFQICPVNPSSLTDNLSDNVLSFMHAF